jgi:hypothetical protein
MTTDNLLTCQRSRFSSCRQTTHDLRMGRRASNSLPQSWETLAV